ncbi:MAG TPA: hypothetical protein VH165_32620 [Kofleriaceae bacterium]|nr:hypothetical protein [Kofleriaceae bacterium]
MAVTWGPAIAAIAAFALGAAGCAPTVDGPVEHQRAIDRDDGDRLAAQLALLPGVVTASVVLHHAARDPLAIAPDSPARLTAVIATDDRAAPDTIRAAALRLAHATVPELDPRRESRPGAIVAAALSIEIYPVVHRAQLARVGPFWVEDSSQRPLRAALAIGCLAIAGLAGVIALRAARDRHRRGSSAQ